MMHRPGIKILALSLILFCLSGKLYAQPRLLVVISYDQMRGDYIERWKKNFARRGFLRLLNEGRNYPNCYFNHASNMTAPGHSILLTGKYPAKTGIVTNDFYERSQKKMHYCVDDSVYGLSPRNMKALTLGDLMKQKYTGSRNIAIGIKDRAAILMAGQNPDAALWFDIDSGAFVSSRYYRTPVWLDEWNEQQPVNQYAGAEWRTVLPDHEAARDNVEAEGKFPGGGKTFPHRIPLVTKENFTLEKLNEFYEAWGSSPYAVENLFALASFVVEKEGLGRDSIPDLLSVGVSTTDFIGHLFGPDSREIEELYVHCDRILGEFIDYLDATVGRENYLLTITADHGVGPIPELHEKGNRLSGKAVLEQANEYLATIFGAKELVKAFQPPSVFLNEDLVARKKLSFPAVVDSLANFFRGRMMMPIVLKPSDIAGRRCGDIAPEICEMIRNDLYPPRTGDLVVYPREYWIYGSNPATHGTPYDYDRHVPMIFFGAGLGPKRSEEKSSPADIAPTLGKFFNITIPAADGNILPLN